MNLERILASAKKYNKKVELVKNDNDNNLGGDNNLSVLYSTYNTFFEDKIISGIELAKLLKTILGYSLIPQNKRTNLTLKMALNIEN